MNNLNDLHFFSKKQSYLYFNTIFKLLAISGELLLNLKNSKKNCYLN